MEQSEWKHTAVKLFTVIQMLISFRLLVDNTIQINVRDITFCIRFNFALLGGWEGRSHLIHIEDWRESPGV